MASIECDVRHDTSISTQHINKDTHISLYRGSRPLSLRKCISAYFGGSINVLRFRLLYHVQVQLLLSIFFQATSYYLYKLN